MEGAMLQLQSLTGMVLSTRKLSARARMKSSAGRFSWLRISCAAFLVCVAAAIASPAQTFQTLVAFNLWDQDNNGVLVQGTDGNLYGTIEGRIFLNGKEGYICGVTCGTVFKVTPTGTGTVVYPFYGGYGGSAPISGLVLGRDGNFYGTTQGGGYGWNQSPGDGTVFKITPDGILTTLHDFDGTDGASPNAALVYTGGNFYGTTSGGGSNGQGTVFKITPDGILTTLHDFDGTDGASPNAALVYTNGNFYGTTSGGGSNGQGTVFKITPDGILTTLHDFDGTDGASPSVLVQAADGNFYGTTTHGGSYGAGTVFKITPSGTLTTLHSFDGTDGASPSPVLVQATDGNFYGTTSYGGTAFKITPAGVLTTLHRFRVAPVGGLVQATDGNFYGTTHPARLSSGVSVFKLSVGLGPFVKALSYSGKVGKIVEFLGQGVTSATKVSFNGTGASRTVVSGTYLIATVPRGATTGFVTVTTSGGTLKSNKIFRVIPQITTFGPTSGAPGTLVTITGVSLTQTRAVTFGGVKATFTVNSDTQVTATVPSGATAGKIVITTPGGTAVSAIDFTVT
jgi:uncharacterized repeat protein (TIGR03803 family)